MTAIKIDLPPKLIPVFDGEADVRGAYGGRGSAKTRSFATMTAVRGYMFGMAGISGQIVCGRQYMNSLEESSLEEVKRSISEHKFLSDYYEVGDKYIKSRDGRIKYTFVGLHKNVSSIKSKGRILLLWVDEAEDVSEASWIVTEPTLREEGEDWNTELWVTWNPRKKGSPTDSRYRGSTDERVKVVELNWRDNPKFPDVLERKRQRDKEMRPDSYDHIWEGAYESVVEGAYYASHITKAKEEGRITVVTSDPLMTNRMFIDIGGTGARADAFAMWNAQFIGTQVRALKYYEAVGQPLSSHIAWLRENGLNPDNTQIWLPHDGSTNDRVYDVSYESAFKAAGYHVTVIPNQGKGAAKARIEASRRMFPSIMFDEEGCEAGLEALGWYHEKKDVARNIGLGPEHDWASHGADAFGLMNIVAESAFNRPKKVRAEVEVRPTANRW